MLFKCNKWASCYSRLIDRAQKTELAGYVEKHHIIPKSMGGSDSVDNIVNLTAREHLVAHKLLVRMANTKEIRRKALAGLWAMAALRNGKNRKLLPSRDFARLREEYFESRRGQPVTKEVREKISSTLQGRKVPDGVIRKRTETLRQNLESGKTRISKKPLTKDQREARLQKYRQSMTDEKKTAARQKARKTVEKWDAQRKQEFSKTMRESLIGKKRTPEQRQKMSESQRGKVVSAETKAKISAAQTGKVKTAVMRFTLRNPHGDIEVKIGKAREVASTIGAGVKYFYLSLSEHRPIQKGKATGWQLLSKERIYQLS